MTSLKGKVAIITGGSREIGAAMAEALAEAGSAVIIAYQEASALAEAVVSRIRESGGQAQALQADLSNVADNQRLIAQTVEAFGRLDIFVANAGLTMWGPSPRGRGGDLGHGGRRESQRLVLRSPGGRTPDGRTACVWGRLWRSDRLFLIGHRHGGIAQLFGVRRDQGGLAPHGDSPGAGTGSLRHHRQRAGHWRDGERAQPARLPGLREALGRSDTDGAVRAAGRCGCGATVPGRARGRHGQRPYADDRRRLDERRSRTVVLEE